MRHAVASRTGHELYAPPLTRHNVIGYAPYHLIETVTGNVDGSLGSTFGHKLAVDAHISSGMETELLSGTKRKCSARLNHKTVENLYRFRAFPTCI